MSDVGKTLRLSNSAGPCLTNVCGAGKVVRETNKFWITNTHNKSGARVSKGN
jgi:hypothetical protein